MADRIKQRMEALGLHQDDLARRVGLTQPAIHKLLSGKTRRTTRLSELSAALGVRPEWLATGKEPMIGAEPSAGLEKALTPRQRVLVDLFDGLTPDQQDAFLANLEATQRRNAEIFEALSRQRNAG